jgi:hypothetical protein
LRQVPSANTENKIQYLEETEQSGFDESSSRKFDGSLKMYFEPDAPLSTSDNIETWLLAQLAKMEGIFLHYCRVQWIIFVFICIWDCWLRINMFSSNTCFFSAGRTGRFIPGTKAIPHC